MTLARVPAASEGGVATTRPGPRRVTSRGAPVVAAIAALALAATAAAGYAIGTSTQSSDRDAAAARRAAEQRAYTAAQRGSVALGRLDGLRAGAAAGTAAGTRAGRRARGAPPPPTARPKPAAVPAGVKDCPKTPIRKKTFVSSVRGITCGAAAAEQQQALRKGSPTRTPKGFTCQKIDAQHYRCIKGSKAYRWDISP